MSLLANPCRILFPGISVENLTLTSAASLVLDQMFLQTNNRRALQAALTSMIQADENFNGALLEIVDGSASNFSLTLQLAITTNQTCNTPICLDADDASLTNILGQNNRTTPAIRYDYFNGTTPITRWLEYRLPDEIQSST